MKTTNILFLSALLALGVACAEHEGQGLAPAGESPILALIDVQSASDGGLSYSVSAGQLAQLAQYDGQTFRVGGQQYVLSLNQATAGGNGSATGPLSVALASPNSGDMLVATSVLEYQGGTFDPELGIVGGTLVDFSNDVTQGAPIRLHQSSIRHDGANNHWLVARAFLHRYHAPSGKWLMIDSRRDVKRLNCRPDRPRARASATWYPSDRGSRGYGSLYVFIKCDD